MGPGNEYEISDKNSIFEKKGSIKLLVSFILIFLKRKVSTVQAIGNKRLFLWIDHELKKTFFV